jgi:hypothetical protein
MDDCIVQGQTQRIYDGTTPASFGLLDKASSANFSLGVAAFYD